MSERAEEAVREADAVFEPRLMRPGMGLAQMETQGGDMGDMPPGYEGLGFEQRSHGRGAGAGAGARVSMAGRMVAGVLVFG